MHCRSRTSHPLLTIASLSITLVAGCPERTGTSGGPAAEPQFSDDSVEEFKQRLTHLERYILDRDLVAADEQRLHELLSKDAEVRKWITSSFDQLSSHQRALVLQIIFRDAPSHVYLELRPVIVAAVANEDNPHWRGMLCLVPYDIPERKELVLRILNSTSDMGLIRVGLRVYLPEFGTEGIEPDRLRDWLYGMWEPGFKAHVAGRLMLHGDEAWRSEALAALNEALDARIAAMAPDEIGWVFKHLAEARREGDAVLLAHAERIAEDGRREARDAAQQYVERFSGE